GVAPRRRHSWRQAGGEMRPCRHAGERYLCDDHGVPGAGRMTFGEPAMRKSLLCLTVLMLTAVAGCVTINVYFPKAAAEKAASQFVGSVIDQKAAEQNAKPEQTPSTDETQPRNEDTQPCDDDTQGQP